MASEPVEAVVFDLGGTLLHYQDGDQPNFRAMTRRGLLRVREGLLDFGYTPLPEDEFPDAVDRFVGAAYVRSMADLRGGSIETPIREGLAAMNIHPGEEQWADLHARFYAVVDDIVSPREGGRETLAALHERGLKLALISNTFWAADLHDRHLREHGLLDYLPHRVYSSQAPHVKPHPAIFRDTLAHLGVAPGRAVYVGDRLDVDVAGAQGVGMRGVLIHSPYVTYASGSTPDVTPDASTRELPELLDKLAQWG